MSQLIIPVGIPGCGKSTWGEQFFNKSTDQIVSTDRIRESLGDVNDQSRNDEVFEEYHRFIGECLEDGFRVYADATNLRHFAREILVKIGLLAEAEIHLVIFANPDQALSRNLKRQRVVPQDVMIRMLDQYEDFRLVLPQEAHMYNSITEIRRVG